MEFLVSFFEFWIGHMCIYLSRRDRCMSKEFLDDADIGTIREKCSREWMTKRVCVEIFKYPCLESVGLYHISDKKTRKSNIIIIQIDTFDIFFRKIVSDKKWREIITSCRYILFYSIFCLRSQIDDTNLSSFSSDSKFHSFKIHIISLKGSELRNTKACRINALRYSIVSNSNLLILWNYFEKSCDLVIWEKCDFSLWDFHEI